MAPSPSCSSSMKPCISICKDNPLCELLFFSRALAEVRSLAKSHSEAFYAAQLLATVSFEHAKVVTAVDCIMSLVCHKNREHYSFATKDSKLRAKLWEVPGVPVIYGLKNSLFIEQPFIQQSQFAQLDEKCKLIEKSEFKKLPMT